MAKLAVASIFQNMKYRVEYESAKDGLVYTKDIEGDSDQIVLKKLVEKYKAEPTKILSCRRIEDMKIKDGTFRIRNSNQYKGYLDPKGNWVGYFYAKKFKSEDEAKEFGKRFLGNEKFIVEFSANDSIKDSSLSFSKDNAWVDRKARFMADKFNLKLETSSSGAQTFIGNRKNLEAFVEY